jgi:hypothetical protein
MDYSSVQLITYPRKIQRDQPGPKDRSALYENFRFLGVRLIHADPLQCDVYTEETRSTVTRTQPLKETPMKE